MLLGGLDIGTTGCKLTVYDDQGRWITNAYREYEISRSCGRHEIDAGLIWDSVCQVIKETAQKAPELAAIGVTSFGETFVMLDEKDQILAPSMIYTDPRGEEEIARLKEIIPESRLIQITGAKPHHTYSLGKMMWMKEHQRELYQRTKRILLMADFIVYRLSGTAVIDDSLAARTAAFDIRRRCFSEEILQAAGIDPSLLSTPVPSGNLAGNMKENLQKAFGFSGSVKIIIAGQDQISAAVGAGVLEPGDTVDGTGTVECITPVFQEIPQDPAFYQHNYSVIPFVFPDTYVCYAYSYTGGAAIKWFRDTFREGTGYEVLNRSLPGQPTGILVLPHFAGAATPYMDNGSKAAILGITLETGLGDLYQAIMEGVTYEMRLNTELLSRFGIRPKCFRATGGGAKSEEWLQIKADILKTPITALDAMEAGACGSCMMSGVTLGLYSDYHQAKQFFVREKKTFLPNPSRQQTYEEIYQRYRQLYQTVRPLINH